MWREKNEVSSRYQEIGGTGNSKKLNVETVIIFFSKIFHTRKNDNRTNYITTTDMLSRYIKRDREAGN